MKRIIIAGGTGFVGRSLQRNFENEGYKVSVISRSAGDISWKDETALKEALDGSDLLINLAGASVNCRFNAENRKHILHSRIETTNQLGSAVARCSVPPKLWINASGAAIYDEKSTTASDENAPTTGSGFMADVARQWEKIFYAQQRAGMRMVALRISLVLGKDGGVMPVYSRLVRFGLGGTMGKGNQMMSWVHIDDMFAMIRFIMDHAEITGAVNCASPNPCTNKEFMSEFRKAMHIPLGIPAYEWMIRLAAPVVGVEADLVLNNMSVMPRKLTDAGFHFRYKNVQEAVLSLNR